MNPKGLHYLLNRVVWIFKLNLQLMVVTISQGVEKMMLRELQPSVVSIIQ